MLDVFLLNVNDVLDLVFLFYLLMISGLEIGGIIFIYSYIYIQGWSVFGMLFGFGRL